MIPVETDPERRKLAYAYMGSATRLREGIAAIEFELTDPPEGLDEAKVKVRTAILSTAIAVLNKRLEAYVSLAQHNLIPTENQFPDERKDSLDQ